MTEPTYEYIKGKGWVASPLNYYTGKIKGLEITVLARTPLYHEAGFYIPGDSKNPEDGFRHLASNDRHPGLFYEPWCCTDAKDAARYGAFTLEIDGHTDWDYVSAIVDKTARI